MNRFKVIVKQAHKGRLLLLQLQAYMWSINWEGVVGLDNLTILPTTNSAREQRPPDIIF